MYVTYMYPACIFPVYIMYLAVRRNLLGHLLASLSTGDELLHSQHMLRVVVSGHQQTRTEVAELPQLKRRAVEEGERGGEGGE